MLKCIKLWSWLLIECKYVRDLFNMFGIEYISEKMSIRNVGIEYILSGSSIYVRDLEYLSQYCWDIISMLGLSN